MKLTAGFLQTVNSLWQSEWIGYRVNLCWGRKRFSVQTSARITFIGQWHWWFTTSHILPFHVQGETFTDDTETRKRKQLVQCKSTKLTEKWRWKILSTLRTDWIGITHLYSMPLAVAGRPGLNFILDPPLNYIIVNLRTWESMYQALPDERLARSLGMRLDSTDI